MPDYTVGPSRKYDPPPATERVGPSKPPEDGVRIGPSAPMPSSRIALSEAVGPDVLNLGTGKAWVKPHQGPHGPVKGFWRSLGEQYGFQGAATDRRVTPDKLKVGDVVMHKAWHGREEPHVVSEHRDVPADDHYGISAHRSTTLRPASGLLNEPVHLRHDKQKQMAPLKHVGHMAQYGKGDHPDDVAHGSLKAGETYADNGHAWTRRKEKPPSWLKGDASYDTKGGADYVHDVHGTISGYDLPARRGHDVSPKHKVRRIKGSPTHVALYPGHQPVRSPHDHEFRV